VDRPKDRRTQSVFVSSVPYESERIYAAAVYCSDGRIGDQVDDFLHHGLSLPRYDRVACPGGPVALSGRFSASWDTRGVEEQLRFLGQVHDVRTVVLIAHASCAYYARRLMIPSDDLEREQLADLQKATTTVNRLLWNVAVHRYFARRSGAEVSFESV
jgi:hypothetical protein